MEILEDVIRIAEKKETSLKSIPIILLKNTTKIIATLIKALSSTNFAFDTHHILENGRDNKTNYVANDETEHSYSSIVSFT